MTRQQMTLDIRLRDEASFDNFVGGDEIVAALRSLLQPSADGPGLVYVWGAPSTGRSHLLHALCRAATESGRTSVYLGVVDSTHLDVAILEDLERLDVLCIDDLDAIGHSREWQQSLYGLLNRLAASGGRLACTARAGPANTDVSLPDLRSRLASGLVLRTAELTDGDKALVLRTRAKRRGLSLSAAAIEYIMRRSRRDMTQLMQVLTTLEEESLRQQSSLSIPFIRQFLAG